MENHLQIKFANADLHEKYFSWENYLKQHCKSSEPLSVNFDSNIPTIIDRSHRKFKIDFLNDVKNYHKHKAGITKEPLSKALGGGTKGLKVLDLTAGLGVDAIFLTQLGFSVIGLERNPIIYMALKIAADEYNKQNSNHKIEFLHSQALDYLKKLKPGSFDVAYFDPMFPDKKKSALPKQEMVLFKNLVGSDDDAHEIVKFVIQSKIFNRFVVKRPLAAEAFVKANGSINGKIIRYDIYGKEI